MKVFLLNKIRKYFNVFIILAIVIAGYFIFRNFNSENITIIKDRLNIIYLVAGFGGILAVVLLRSLRWVLLLKPIKSGLSFLNLVEIYASSQLVNYASPGKFGVPAKAVLLKKMESVSITRSTPSLLSELFLDNTTIFFMMIGAAVTSGYFAVVIDLFKRHVFKNLIEIILFLVVCIILFGLLFLVFKQKVEKSTFYQNLVSAIRDSAKQPKYFSISFSLTLIIHILSYFCDWLILSALGLNISYLFVVMTFSFSTIAGFLSPLPGGIGVREISNTYLFEIFYNMGELALIVTILRRALDYLLSIILFGYAKTVKYFRKISLETPEFSIRNSDE